MSRSPSLCSKDTGDKDDIEASNGPVAVTVASATPHRPPARTPAAYKCCCGKFRCSTGALVTAGAELVSTGEFVLSKAVWQSTLAGWQRAVVILLAVGLVAAMIALIVGVEHKRGSLILPGLLIHVFYVLCLLILAVFAGVCLATTDTPLRPLDIFTVGNEATISRAAPVVLVSSLAATPLELWLCSVIRGAYLEACRSEAAAGPANSPPDSPNWPAPPRPLRKDDDGNELENERMIDADAKATNHNNNGHARNLLGQQQPSFDMGNHNNNVAALDRADCVSKRLSGQSAAAGTPGGRPTRQHATSYSSLAALGVSRRADYRRGMSANTSSMRRPNQLVTCRRSATVARSSTIDSIV